MNAMLAAILSERTHVDRHLKKNGCALFSSLSQIGKQWQGEREGDKKGVGELANGECECGWRRDRQSCQLPLQLSFSLPHFHSLSVSLWAMSFDVLGIICLKCVRAL